MIQPTRDPSKLFRSESRRHARTCGAAPGRRCCVILCVLAACVFSACGSERRTFGAPAQTTESPAAYVAQQGRFSVAKLPEPFKVWRDETVSPGVNPEVTVYAQRFLDERLNRSFTVSVLRGPGALSDRLDYPVLKPSERSVHGQPTYVADVAITKQMQLAWALDESTAASVIGSGMSLDELYAIAETVEVSR